MEYYIYMIRCEDGTLYTGITTDLLRRFKEHASKKGDGAKYTFVHKPIGIAVAWKTKEGRSAASRLEARLKKLKKQEKEKLVESPGILTQFLDESFENISFIPVTEEEEQ